MPLPHLWTSLFILILPTPAMLRTLLYIWSAFETLFQICCLESLSLSFISHNYEYVEGVRTLRQAIKQKGSRFLKIVEWGGFKKKSGVPPNSQPPSYIIPSSVLWQRWAAHSDVFLFGEHLFWTLPSQLKDFTDCQKSFLRSKHYNTHYMNPWGNVHVEP